MSKDEIVRVMKEWTMASVEKRYNEHLKTEEGAKLIEVGEGMRKWWAEHKATIDPIGMSYTKNVREGYLPDAWKGKAKKVTIVPIGENNCCVQNAMWLFDTCGWEMVWGFNICACRCGGRMTLEPHYLNRHPDGSYVDITRDFAGETEKWFLPVENKSFTFVEYRQMYQGDFVVYQPACKCMKRPNKWDNTSRILFEDEDEMEGWIEDLKQYPKREIRNVVRF